MEHFKSTDELMAKAYQAIGIPFKNFDINNRLATSGNKGMLGHIIEEGFFGYEINNNQNPDFEELGIELKVTPFKKINKGDNISAKERLVLTNINFLEDYDVDFYNSKCYHKLDKILLMLYEYQRDLDKGDFQISNVLLYDFENSSEKDKYIIQQDYEYITNKIRNGEAHTISEGDTMYLGACTKGATAKSSMVKQPNSSEPARKRAFSFKQSYMTQILRSAEHTYTPLVSNPSSLKNKSLKDFIEALFTPYIGKTLDQIDVSLNTNINRNAKSYLASYASAMMKIGDTNPEQLEEFNKANIKLKTVRVNKNNKINESMSFPAFKFLELLEENWNESTLRNDLINQKFLFCVFKEVDDSKKNYIFQGVKLWSMPENTIDTDVKETWDEVRKIALEGIEFTQKIQKNKIIIENNLPSKFETSVIHVRPHARRRIYIFANGQKFGEGTPQADGDILPDGTIITKQCFFINSDYILQVISSLL